METWGLEQSAGGLEKGPGSPRQSECTGERVNEPARISPEQLPVSHPHCKLPTAQLPVFKEHTRAAPGGRRPPCKCSYSWKGAGLN